MAGMIPTSGYVGDSSPPQAPSRKGILSPKPTGTNISWSRYTGYCLPSNRVHPLDTQQQQRGRTGLWWLGSPPNEVIGSPKSVEKVPGDAVPVLAEEELLGVDDNKRKKLPNDQDEGSVCHRHTPCKERCYQKGPHKTESPSPQWFGRNGQDTRKARIILHEENEVTEWRSLN